MIALFSNPRIGVQVRPSNNVIDVRRIEHIRGVRFTGLVLVPGWDYHRDKVEAYYALIERQPELDYKASK